MKAKKTTRGVFLSLTLCFVSLGVFEARVSQAQVIQGTFDVFHPTDPTLRVASTRGDCGPLHAWRTEGAQAGFPTETITAGEGTDMLYLYDCAGHSIRLSIWISTDFQRHEAHLLYPQNIWINSMVEVRPFGETEYLLVGRSEQTVDTEMWGSNHGIEVGIPNENLIVFPGIRIFDVQAWVDWNTPWNTR